MKAIKKDLIDDAQIIELFESGYSQQDIIAKYRVTVQRTRSVLTAAGYDTSNFRRLSKPMVDIIVNLLRTGSSFQKIETVCDISYHAVHAVVERNNLQFVSTMARESISRQDLCIDVPERDEFIAGYVSGESFCSMCHKLALPMDAIISLYYQISPENIEAHRENLRKHIIEDSKKLFSAAGIARKRQISQSVVRNALKAEKTPAC